MTGFARPAPPFTLMFDSLADVTRAQAEAMFAKGFRTKGCYLEVLSISQRDILFAAGLGIVPITEARVGNLSADYGMRMGAESVRLAMNLGIPPSVHLWIDDEATHGSTLDVAGYLGAFSQTIDSGGYDAGLYIGADQPLNGAQLYSIPTIDRYARGGSVGIPEPGCGFCWWQIPPLDYPMPELGGFKVDVSVLGWDARGRAATVWVPG